MKHFFEKGSSTLFVVFHGTGGDEHDLVPLVKKIDSAASILSLRGNINEHGMNRFFKRFSFGVFDIKDIQEQASIIHTFLQDKVKNYEKVFFLGYSNGANMIVALMQLYPSLIENAILLHPMKVLDKECSLNSTVFVSYGLLDTMIPVNESLALISFLKKSGCSITSVSLNQGHSITQNEVVAIANFVNNFNKN